MALDVSDGEYGVKREPKMIKSIRKTIIPNPIFVDLFLKILENNFLKPVRSFLFSLSPVGELSWLIFSISDPVAIGESHRSKNLRLRQELHKKRILPKSDSHDQVQHQRSGLRSPDIRRLTLPKPPR